LPAGTGLIQVKFQLNNPCDRIEQNDIINPEVLINGFEGAFVITTPQQVVVPEVQILTTAPYCPGTPVSFSYPAEIDGQGINSYNWNFSNGIQATGQSPTVSITTEGINVITLQMITGLGCSFEAVSSINISEGPEASFESTVIQNTTEVSFNSTSTVANGTITSYSWNFGDGSALSTEEDPTHEFPSSGPYQVTLTATSDIGCSDAVTITVDVPVSIDEQASKVEIGVFPNPAESMVFLQSDRDLNYRLVDESGRLIDQDKISASKQKSLNIRELAAGVYYFTFSNEHIISTRKLVVR
jgi:PKD repeat protein